MATPNTSAGTAPPANRAQSQLARQRGPGILLRGAGGEPAGRGCWRARHAGADGHRQRLAVGRRVPAQRDPEPPRRAACSGWGVSFDFWSSPAAAAVVFAPARPPTDASARRSTSPAGQAPLPAGSRGRHPGGRAPARGSAALEEP